MTFTLLLPLNTPTSSIELQRKKIREGGYVLPQLDTASDGNNLITFMGRSP